MKLAVSFASLVLASVAVGALAPRPAQPPLPAALLGAGLVCLQDQYGIQYSFTVDQEHQYVYGEAAGGQLTGVAPWPLTGSYVVTADGLLLELTAANPEAPGSTLVRTYKLKGLFPRFAWYYETGYGAQESAYVTCGSDATAAPSAGGALGLSH
jgi:hypothetical protein